MLTLMLPLIVGGNFVSPLFQLLLVVAGIAILWWGFNRIAIPEPIKTILLVVVCLVGLFVIAQIVGPMIGAGG